MTSDELLNVLVSCDKDSKVFVKYVEGDKTHWFNLTFVEDQEEVVVVCLDPIPGDVNSLRVADV